jgi:hypothetical protein
MGEFGDAAKESQVPKIKLPKIKVIPKRIARTENLEAHFMRAINGRKLNSLAFEATSAASSKNHRRIGNN